MVLIRSTRKEDIKAVAAIEQECFPPSLAYDEKDLKHILKRDYTCLVAIRFSTVVGHLIACVVEERAYLVSCGVVPAFRRQRIGTQLLRQIQEMLPLPEFTAVVREDMLHAQLWLRSNHFVAVDILKGTYKDHDAYEMSWLRPD